MIALIAVAPTARLACVAAPPSNRKLVRKHASDSAYWPFCALPQDWAEGPFQHRAVLCCRSPPWQRARWQARRCR